MPTARSCQTCGGKRWSVDRLRKPQVCLDLGSATTGHRHRRGYAIEPELHKTRGTDLDIVHVFQIDQITAVDTNKALGGQAPLERGNRLIDQVCSLGANGVAKIGACLKVADIRHGNEYLFAPAIHRQAQRLARSMETRRAPRAVSILSSAFDKRASSTGLTM